MPSQGMEEDFIRSHNILDLPFLRGGQPNVQPAVFSNFEPYQLQEAEVRNLEIC